MKTLTKSLVYVLVFVIFISAYPAFAQDDARNVMNKKILDLDDTLVPQITATLTGLSLTGASFLVNVGRSTDGDTVVTYIRLARRSFIKAFFMFLICTIVLFVFDFIEVMDEGDIILSTILDVVISYAFFGAGVVYLVNAARKLYVTFGK